MISTSKSRAAIRAALAEDVPQLCSMMSRLAVELGTSGELHADEAAWERNSFGIAPKFSVIIAECEGKLVGMATYSPLYVPDVGKDYVFVHHLYVEDAFRRRGIAKSILAKIAAQAVAEDRPVLELGTILTTPRRRFFEAVGFHVIGGYATYILFGDALTRLASLSLDALG